MTKQKELILNIIHRSMNHPTAEDIYIEAKKIMPSISQGTVYRNLNLLVESNEVRRITGLDSKEHYDKSLIPHEHFICQKCGKIEDVFDMDIISYLKKNTNKRINSYELIVKGYCSLCNERV